MCTAECAVLKCSAKCAVLKCTAECAVLKCSAKCAVLKSNCDPLLHRDKGTGTKRKLLNLEERELLEDLEGKGYMD